MIKIAISVEAFEAVARTLPLGTVSFENAVNERGERLIWLDRAVVDRLRSLRGPGESFSDVILRLTATEGAVIKAFLRKIAYAALSLVLSF